MVGQHASRARFAAAVALTAVLGTAPALRAASPEERASARQHASRAEELKKQSKLAEACAELEQVERLDPKLPTLLDLAECNESIGKLVEAQAQWALARDRARRDEKPQSRTRAEARLAAVQKRVPLLTLQLTPIAQAGAQVSCDGVALEASSLSSEWPLNPGEHSIVVKLAGHDDAKYAVKLGDGDRQTLPIAAGPVTSSQASPAVALPASGSAAPLPALPNAPADAPPVEAPVATGWWTGPHKAGVVFGSLGLVAIGAGAALVAGGHSGRVDQTTTLGGISIATGGALLVSGLVLLVSAPRDDAAQHAGLSVTPTLVVARNSALLGAAAEF